MSQDPGQTLSNDGRDFVATFRNDTYPAIDPLKADLSGKHVFISGASKGVGKATAISYAQAGASGIAIGARSSLESVTKEIQKAAKKAERPVPKILALNLDVTDPASVSSAASQVSEAFGDRLDVLINNAGYLSHWLPLVDTDPEEWWRDWEVNVKGVYLTTRAFLPLLLRGSLKTIVSISSIGAHFLIPNSSAYDTSKLAVLRFSEFLNVDYGAQGILAYSVHPGGVKTDLALGLPEALHEHFTDEPELPGNTLVWLTKERREWLAGRYISVNWDVNELLEKKDDILKGDLLKVRMAVNNFST